MLVSKEPSFLILPRNPDIAARPSFSELTRQLSLPDTKLLKWLEEDKSVLPEAAQLASASDLYVDLQAKYKPNSSGRKFEGPLFSSSTEYYSNN